jgi:hypothetical protein
MSNPDHGNMTRDERDEWPSDEPVGSFDIDLGGVQGYPGATAHIIFVCPNGHRCGVLVGPQFVNRPTPDALCIWGWNGDRDKARKSARMARRRGPRFVLFAGFFVAVDFFIPILPLAPDPPTRPSQAPAGARTSRGTDPGSRSRSVVAVSPA